MRYRQLTEDERYQIQVLKRMKRPNVDIARELGRHPSTIARELARNGTPYVAGRYLASRAHRLAQARRVAKGAAGRKIRGKLQVLVEKKLRLGWSPEQIAGRLRQERRTVTVSHETIYQHVIRDAQQQGILRYCLRFGGYKHFRCKKSKMAERTRARKNWIDRRPAAANERREVGHWERDCLLGNKKSRSAFLTIIDRKTRYTRIRRVAKVQIADVSAATIDALTPFRRVTKTVTNDNGAEFQQSEPLARRLGAKVFYCEPSSPWQRGSVENLNGLLRQYVGKGADIDALPDWTSEALEHTLNHRPRKVLGYRTPHEAMFKKRLPMLSNQRMHFGLEFSIET